jgi:hypothetical protein
MAIRGPSNFIHRVQTGSEVHPVSSALSPRDSLFVIKRPRREADHSPLSIVEDKNGGVVSAQIAWCLN